MNKPSHRKIWYHHPPLPIPDTPVFDWPPRLPDALKWIRDRWFGSFHDGTEAANERIRQRVRERALKSKRDH